MREQIRIALRELRPRGAISGMALGVDTWAAEECVKLGIPFVAAVPFKGQEGEWPWQSQQHYRDLLAKSFRIYVVSPGAYEPEKMMIRNKWMVDRCSTLIAVYNGDKKGGTANCVNYAKGLGRETVVIDPRNFDVPG